MAKYRGAVIGLGWMGMLYDLAERIGVWHVDDIDRPTPELDIHRKFYYHNRHLSRKSMPTSYAEALSDRPEITLVAAAERDHHRLAVFGERYGVEALYADAKEMLRQEKPDIVAISTNTKGRADLTCCAVESGAKGIVTEKPMACTLEEADRMVKACANAGVPLCCGAISTSHPSFRTAKDLVTNGAIGEVLSIEAESDKNLSQHQNWSYFVDSNPAWVIGLGDLPKRKSGSNEFRGQGMMVTDTGLVVHFRKGAPAVRITGTTGELFHPEHYSDWTLFQEIETPTGRYKIEMPWPGAKMQVGGGSINGLADVMDCLAGELDEPKNSGRRVAVALEVEIAIKLSSAQGGQQIDLPLGDRSLGLEYDWHR
ncbi:Gfo/Idh/MocA family oxidoreductase [Candidatus Poribacteria bacterium]|nr:Gfo/Idh/MocA family oxidoreductase [Candidatus Poribacteria bacterium]